MSEETLAVVAGERAGEGAVWPTQHFFVPQLQPQQRALGAAAKPVAGQRPWPTTSNALKKMATTTLTAVS